jgi:signal transduction histidine kinase
VSKNDGLNQGTMKFRPKARLLHLLGHELITDENIALIELAKNSYDADARSVTVTLSDVTDKRKGKITIDDDGHGMTLKVIETAWMEPARDNKKGSDGLRARTKRFNRLPLGEKGIGRFSADKMGLKLEIISRACDFDPKTKEPINIAPDEVVVTIDGSQFAEDAYLDQIECTWIKRSPEKFIGSNSNGTSIIISQIRTDWSKELIEKVRLGLARLSSPFDNAKDFEVIFISTDFPELSTKIENPLLKIAPYFLDASVSGDGIMNFTMTGPDNLEQHGEKDLRIGLEEFLLSGSKENEYRKPECGPFHFKLYSFERDKTKRIKYGMDKPKIDLLNQLCGVSIYRDHFRVSPYGEHGNDWLNFDRRRVQNPGKVLGNDRVIGFVEISQHSNPQLRDKTNREGLIEDGLSFRDLAKLCEIAADDLGLFRYLSETRETRSAKKIEEAKKDIDSGNLLVSRSSSRVISALQVARKKIEENQIEEAKNALDLAINETHLGSSATKQIESGGKKLLEELMLSGQQIDSLVSLSGIGMTAERMTHEISKAIESAEDLIQNSLGRINRERNTDPEISKNLTRAIRQLEVIILILKQMEPLYYSKRTTTETININDLARDMEQFFSNTLTNLHIKLSIVDDSPLMVEANRGHLMQVFNNLFDNSFYWLKYRPREKQPKITIKISGKDRSFIFADNGPGVDKNIENHLFKPFVSTKPDGRGLGLYIVQDILQNYNGSIDLCDEKILCGANFKISFSED